MNVEFNEEKIRKTLRDFYNATGIDMDLLKTDFSPACGYPLHNNDYCRAIQRTAAGSCACRQSDSRLLEKCRDTKTIQTHICHAGLVDVAIPLLYDGAVIGYIIFGRMKPDRDLSRLQTYLSGLGLEPGHAEALYNDIPFYDESRIRSVSGIAEMVVKYILLENMLSPAMDSGVDRAAAYIREHLSGDLSLQALSRNAGISKSALYSGFHQRYGCTVNSYIKAQRVERSTALLTGTNLSVEEISQRTGFSSASYYSKIFKAQTGLSPLQYRKRHS